MCSIKKGRPRRQFSVVWSQGVGFHLFILVSGFVHGLFCAVLPIHFQPDDGNMPCSLFLFSTVPKVCYKGT